MKSIKITFGPVPYFLMPRLLGTEHRKPAEVGRAEALPLRKRIICGEYHPPAIRFWKSYKFVLVPVRFFSEDNKELLIIPGASHTDLYDGGGKDAIPFDKIEAFMKEYLK